MSLNKKKELTEIAKQVCRELRKNSTPAEKLFWEVVRDRKLLNKKFYRQFPIFYDYIGKESFFVADFYCNENKVAVEFDGVIHKYQLKNDRVRTEVINSLGIRVVRFSNQEIEKDIKIVLEKLKEVLK